MAKFYFHLFTLFLGCWVQFSNAQVIETTVPLVYDQVKSTIKTRFSPPPGFSWVHEPRGSFQEYIANFPLHPPGFPVRDYNTRPIDQQKYHAALLKIDVGNKDLQQCADAWIRLYAEYLWSQKRFDEIGFQFTSGQFFSWMDFKNGMRTKELKNKVRFYTINSVDDSYQNFRQYLQIIFRYAGTISLDRESVAVKKNEDIEIGDFLIKPGSPGHCVIVVGVARNKSGQKRYLLAESFMPAQDIHILKNLGNPQSSPWYEINVNAAETATAKYTFKPTSVKRFHALAHKKSENLF